MVSASWFSMSHGTISAKWPAAKVTWYWDMGCGPTGSSRQRPNATSNRAPSRRLSLAAAARLAAS